MARFNWRYTINKHVQQHSFSIYILRLFVFETIEASFSWHSAVYLKLQLIWKCSITIDSNQSCASSAWSMIRIFIGLYIELTGLFLRKKIFIESHHYFWLIWMEKMSVREKRQFRFVCLNFNRYSIPLNYRNNQFWLTLYMSAYHFIIVLMWWISLILSPRIEVNGFEAVIDHKTNE